MGFPEWTLWGMGISALGAVFFLMLSLLGQSPGFLKRTGLGGARLKARTKAYTTYALAMILLGIGFFLAGVPIGGSDTARVQLGEETSVAQVSTADGELNPTSTASPAPQISPTSTRATPITGAFGGPPEVSRSATPIEDQTTLPTSPVESEVEAATVTLTRQLIATQVLSTDVSTSTTTPTATPTPTTTPTPSLTPTPILQNTAVITTSGSTIWLRRSPGGQNLTLVSDGDLVILGDGHANQGGVLWREVITLDGLVGWIREEFLAIEVSFQGLD